MIEIKSWSDGRVLYSGEHETVKEAAEKAVKNGVSLTGADLRDADLGGANLMDAKLGGADLRDAYLSGADLRDAYLSVKTPPVNSHDFISEVLYGEAKTEAQKDFASRISREQDECWEYFINLAGKKRVLTWAKKVLFKWAEFEKAFDDNAK